MSDFGTELSANLESDFQNFVASKGEPKAVESKETETKESVEPVAPISKAFRKMDIGSAITDSDKKPEAKEETPPVKEEPKEEPKRPKGKKFVFKADGENVELDVDIKGADAEKVKQLLSLGHHASQKINKVNMKERELENTALYWQRLAQDPDALLQYYQGQGYDMSKVAEKLQPKRKEAEELPEEIKSKLKQIDNDYDTESEKREKQAFNDLVIEQHELKKYISEIREKEERNEWVYNFSRLAPHYGIPANAAGNIASLMSAGYQKYGARYTMDHAMADYRASLPEFDTGIDAIKKNETLWKQIQDEIISKYVSEESERKEASSTVPKLLVKSPSSVSEHKESPKPSSPRSFKMAMEDSLGDIEDAWQKFKNKKRD